MCLRHGGTQRLCTCQSLCFRLSLSLSLSLRLSLRLGLRLGLSGHLRLHGFKCSTGLFCTRLSR